MSSSMCCSFSSMRCACRKERYLDGQHPPEELSSSSETGPGVTGRRGAVLVRKAIECMGGEVGIEGTGGGGRPLQ
jgi:hypothetical protein